MATKYLLGLVLSLALSTAFAGVQSIDPALGCKNNPAVVGNCFTVTGDVLVYNGSPTVRILPKGSKHLLGVIPSENEIMPNELKQQIGLTRRVSAVMEICPFTLPKPHNMQLVCVESAKEIEVEPLR
jgi:hypothetical protein